jgi:proline dehydrogenase
MTLLDRLVALTLPLVPKPIVRRIASRYIAGENIEDGLRAVTRLNQRGIRATLDVLGEDIHHFEQAEKAAAEYHQLLDDIHRQRLDANVSIKLTQFGLKIDRNKCVNLVASLVDRARDLGNFVRMDMEDSSCTSDTLSIYRELRQTRTNVGIVVQAYLHRTLDDVDSLVDLQPNFRLCKGVYVEPEMIAYHDMRMINQNYVTILERLLHRGSYVGIATHDAVIVQHAMRLINRLKLPSTAYEFQMLLGVQEELRNRIHAAGHGVRVYIPFGRDWYAYSVRRLRENPRLAGYVLKAMIR